MNLMYSGLMLAYIFILTSAMYFDLTQHREKCIIEEIPEDTLITGYFLLEQWEENKERKPLDIGLTVTVKDPNHEVWKANNIIKILLMKRFGRYGKFTFTSHASGPHFLCVKSNMTRFMAFADDRLKVHLDIQMGEHAIDPNDAKAKDAVKNTVISMEYRMSHLIDQIHYISRQQDFQREREETFRQMSEKTNGSVLWWAIIQTSILLIVGFWQMRSLRNFLIEKKLV